MTENPECRTTGGVPPEKDFQPRLTEPELSPYRTNRVSRNPSTCRHRSQTEGLQNHENMSSDGHNVDVMNGKDLKFWTFLVGFLLCVSVCDAGCIEMNFNETVSSTFLKDHIFQMKNFTCPGETSKKEHNLLSVIAMVCSSFKANQVFYNSNGTYGRVLWAFEEILVKLAEQDDINTSKIFEFCDKHACNHSYGSRYITVDEFKQIYKSVCASDVNSTACPGFKKCEVTQSCPPCSTQCPVTQSPAAPVPSSATHRQHTTTPSVPRNHTERLSTTSVESALTNGSNSEALLNNIFKRSDLAVLILIIILAVSLLLNLGLFLKIRHLPSHRGPNVKNEQSLELSSHASPDPLKQTLNMEMLNERSQERLLQEHHGTITGS